MKKFPIFLSITSFVFSFLVALLVFAHEEGSTIKEIKPMVDETHHLEVKPESLEGYRLPYMKVTVNIIEQDTKKEKVLELHSMFGGNLHYGINVALKPKEYRLKFHLDAPTFARGKERENQWFEPIDAEFLFDASKKFEKSIKIGNKETKDMKISFEAEHAESMFILEGTEQEHTTMGHQTMGEEAKPQVSSLGSDIPAILLYGIFLVVGAILGFIISLFIKSVPRK